MLLAYDDYGPGPVVVLLHGFPLNRSMWSGLKTNFGTIYRVIAPDLRGHGDSASPEGVYTMDEMAGDVVELLDVLQIREPVILGGLSMGGYVALALMERHPERVRALMLMDTKATADSPEAARNREELARQVVAGRSVEPVVKTMLPRVVSEATRAGRPEVVDQVRKMMTRTSVNGASGALRGMAARPDRSSVLAGLTIPTLLLFGDEDAITPPEVAREMSSSLPTARLAFVKGAGHLAPLEKPKEANAAILDFLRGAE